MGWVAVSEFERTRRRKGREAALQVLFAADLSGELRSETIEAYYAVVGQEFSLPRQARERSLELITGIARNLKSIDEVIERASRNWKVSRIASVDRNIIRVAVYELLFEPNTPNEVVIDEAIEIAKRFAGESSPAFVNGVLDRISRDVANGKA